MPADPRTLRARRRAAAEARHRRRVTLGVAAALGLAAGLTGLALGIGGADESEESAAAEAEARLASEASSTPAASSVVDEPEGNPEPSQPELDPRELAGQRLIAGFDGGEAPAGLKRLIHRGGIAGVILFDDNIAGRGATRRLISRLQRIRRPAGLTEPLLIMVDQEGGLVERVSGPPSASGEEMGQRGTSFAAAQGAATARSLGELGINIDLAPVLDVARGGSAIAAEGRSFGTSPRRVSGVAVNGFARGLREGGVAATAKHFPGFGSAAVNTDFAAQRIETSRARLRRIDGPPFAAFAAAGGELVMLSVASYSAFGGRPAALDRSIATRELRGRLGFDGVSITDSLDAEAVLSFAGRRRVARLAAGAGSDLLLYSDWRTARLAGEALRHGLVSGRLDRAEFENSVRRVLDLRAGMPG